MSDINENPHRSLVIVRASVMLAMINVVSTEETRYYLNGVFIEPHKDGGIVLTATDGHRLATVYDREGYAEGAPQIWALPKHITQVKARVAQLKKDYRFHKPYLRYEQDGNRFNLFCLVENCVEDARKISHDAKIMEYLATDCAIDGTFPDYGRVLPTLGQERTGAYFQARYLQSMGKFALDLFDTRSPGIQMELAERGAPVTCRMSQPDEYLDAIYVIMPFRGDYGTELPHYPEWVVTHTGREELGPPAPAEETPADLIYAQAAE